LHLGPHRCRRARPLRLPTGGGARRSCGREPSRRRGRHPTLLEPIAQGRHLRGPGGRSAPALPGSAPPRGPPSPPPPGGNRPGRRGAVVEGQVHVARPAPRELLPVLGSVEQGTFIARYMRKCHGFSTREAIGWLRIMRPGSVIGEQQHCLCSAVAGSPRRQGEHRPFAGRVRRFAEVFLFAGRSTVSSGQWQVYSWFYSFAVNG
jgi:hypothetical protein